MKPTTKYFLVLFLVLALIGLSTARYSVQAQSGATATPRPLVLNLTNQLRATVSVTGVSHNSSGTALIGCGGSGTLVSADGLILTNAHFVRASASCPLDSILIGVPTSDGQSPIPTYYADLVEVNIGWDLAVLRITRSLDGRTITPGTLVLPYVTIGDSSGAALRLDDSIVALGYPGGSDPAITTNNALTVRGTIANFLDEAFVGSHAWIKVTTVTRLPGGLSGGGAYDENGNLIGVPTVVPSPDQPQACRTIQDTNGDGRVDNQDACIPVAGTITQLRPSNLARGLVLAARLRLTVTSSAALSVAQTATGTPKISRLLFAPGLNAAGMPTTIIRTAPTGTRALYVFFDYDQMTDGLTYEVRATLDGVPAPQFSLAPGTWSGGQTGLWYIGSNSQTLPNGTYTFTVLINGQYAGDAKIAIGGGASTSPTFSDVLFGSVQPGTTQLILTGDVLAAQGTINAQFVYSNLSAQSKWHQEWYYNGQLIAQTTDQLWTDGANGTKQITASGKNALLPGRYRLNLFIDGQLSTTADFAMGGVQQSGDVQIFDKVAFASGLQGDTPQGTNAAFSTALTQLYGTFTWHNLAVGTPWTWELLVDGSPLFTRTQPWADPGTHALAYLELSSDQPLPDGSYTLRLSVAGVAISTVTAKVGLGQLPVNLFAPAVGVQLNGVVIDAATDQPIPGTTVIVLNPAFATGDYTGSAAQIEDMLTTDSQGRFQLSHLLARGNTYSMLVRAEGYSAMSTDALTLDDSTISPLVLTIQMSRN